MLIAGVALAATINAFDGVNDEGGVGRGVGLRIMTIRDGGNCLSGYSLRPVVSI